MLLFKRKKLFEFTVQYSKHQFLYIFHLIQFGFVNIFLSIHLTRLSIFLLFDFYSRNLYRCLKTIENRK